MVDEVETAMIEAGVPAGRVYTAAEMLEDPHFKARQSLIEIDHPRWGKLPMQNAFPKLSDTPGRVGRIAPQSIGEHSREVLAERLGLSETEIDNLQKDGVV